MLARALIVILLVLNLGVAAWWLARPAMAPPAWPESTAGGVPLQLASPPAPAAASPRAAAEGPPRCLRLGPFDEAGKPAELQSALAGLVAWSVVEEVPGTAPGYRVLVPPLQDREAAQALAARIEAAGFGDLLVLAQGDEANAIALGSYRSREGAEQRLQALREAGFPAQLRAQGRSTAPSRWWLELETTRARAVQARLGMPVAGDCELHVASAGPGAAGALR